MRGGLVISAVVLGAVVVALLCLTLAGKMPAQPFKDAETLSRELETRGVNWYDSVSKQLYNTSFLQDLVQRGLGSTLWGYRAIDMLAQVFLILGAACGVTALFRVEPPKEVAEEEKAVIEAPIEEAEEEEV
jgi:hypothetical protein